ncbi:Aspartate--tRNA ligase, mitochondrial [Eumeta japonica]|uniref:Aspartate--tRNA ligase, mitochondrial n=1 Tax=Eumeta variegata TaxID=151549 RepID=A0A4C1XLW2_EUMVA|nr:Aspartate--tRNA ligase, mitochondrial [Eumeta japonica]
MYGSGGYNDKDHSLAIQPLMQNNSFNPFWVTQQNYGTPYRPNCGELRKHDIGRLVELAGKIHKTSKDRFIQLKDYHGITQLVLPTNDNFAKETIVNEVEVSEKNNLERKRVNVRCTVLAVSNMMRASKPIHPVMRRRTDLQRRFSKIPLQSYVVVVGEVRGRPGRGHNEKLQTGDIEVEVHDILMVKINKIDRKVQVPALPEGLERPSEINPPKITSEEYNKLNNKGLLYLLNNRKYTCADLPYMINKQVSLTCWIEKATKKFLFIMDGYGKIQAVVPSNNQEMENFSANLKQNDIIHVKGIITLRPEAQINPASVNGHIELQLEVLETPSAEQLQIKNEDISMQVESSPACRFSTRTHTCGELRPSHVGQKITLCGWMHFQRLSKFLILRDGYGFIQCVVSEQVKDITLSTIPLESILKVEGIVVMRPPSMENEQFTTGDVEVLAEKITVLNKANNLQVSLSDSNSLLCEQMRLTYRYVDLRSQKMQSNLRLRSQILQNVRNFLIDRNGFIEVETPLLTKKMFDISSSYPKGWQGTGVYTWAAVTIYSLMALLLIYPSTIL